MSLPTSAQKIKQNSIKSNVTSALFPTRQIFPACTQVITFHGEEPKSVENSRVFTKHGDGGLRMYSTLGQTPVKDLILYAK
jgi:hypothetical protein